MWGFARLARNITTQTSRATFSVVKQSSYTPMQKVWANMYAVVDVGKQLPFRVAHSIYQVSQL